MARTHSEGDRSGKRLSWLTRSEPRNSPIGAICLNTGLIVNTQANINSAFRDYYSTLYKAHPPPSTTSMIEFFNDITINYLTTAQTADLDRPIDTKEIHRALQQLSQGKAPGSDGQPPEYYTTFSSQILTPYRK
ncbi:hypothetical protein NDU88_004488 [Pleurodeles waltl]|uniref:Uncharacterized protein n=1 Tax=Pleurodeles waltl TaxID=8319 RepID=A0AAV7TRM0_PLEWA|nr:hypothetical protein NDU88_004488 [Pleurodeles waltl]